MRRAPTILAAFGAALVALAWWCGSDVPAPRDAPPASATAHPAAPPPPAPAPAPPTAAPVRGSPDLGATRVPPSPAPPTPAPGRAFRAEHDNSTAGIVDPEPPADAVTWAARRRDRARAWEEGSLAAARAFAEEHGLTEAEAQRVEAALRRFHADMAALRDATAAGARSPDAFRDGAATARERTQAAIAEALGPDRAGALRDHLAAQQPGGGF